MGKAERSVKGFYKRTKKACDVKCVFKDLFINMIKARSPPASLVFIGQVTKHNCKMASLLIWGTVGVDFWACCTRVCHLIVR